jgi:hypothetical protein
MSYAARGGDVDAIALVAPGHAPETYMNFQVTRESIQEARRMVAAGQADTRRDFNDLNQGRALQVRMTAKDFLSYFDPASDAEMSVTAPRIPQQTPVLWVIGDADPMLGRGRGYVFDKLPVNPKSQYLQVSANHLTTPGIAKDTIAAWIRAAVTP